MHILLLTGIYPPEIGGPATYAYNLAEQLTLMGHTVVIITYGEADHTNTQDWSVHYVSRKGTFIQRYLRMRRAIKHHGNMCDIVYSFGTVSTGIPLYIAGKIKAKTILRLGGDFAWERYTDKGGTLPLPDFYKTPPLFWRLVQLAMRLLLTQYDHVVFSTTWQQDIYNNYYIQVAHQSHIPNALQLKQASKAHELQFPIKLLSFGRLVKLKNISSLITAMALLPNATLTIAGSGPEALALKQFAERLHVTDRVTCIGVIDSSKKQVVFDQHSMLVIPSFSDISPNAALEALASGLPVVLTQLNGLAPEVQQAMHVCDLHTPELIVQAVQYVQENYSQFTEATNTITHRNWSTVAKEHLQLFINIFHT